jgi:Protein of unknown function (DUF1549)/Protein of unknown function (DUF1553)
MLRTFTIIVIPAVALALGGPSRGLAARQAARRARPPGPRAPHPAADFARLRISPAAGTLVGRRSEQRLLVTAELPGGVTRDVTDAARVEVTPAGTARLVNGLLVPLRSGKVTVTARYGERQATVGYTLRLPPQEPPVSFLNEVIPVLTKAGCNAGACHGSQYGKGGLRLSLLGYDPEADRDAILKDALGRRVTLAQPEQSLILRKPSAALPHGGGLRLPRDSAGYATLLAWLRGGAPGPAPKERLLVSLTLTPGEATLGARSPQHLLATARYDDGSTRDVTRWTRFVSNYDNVAAVDDAGRVTLVGTGEAVIRAHFGGQVAIARLTVPLSGVQGTTDHRPPTTDHRADARTPEHLNTRSPERLNFVDDAIFAKLRRLGIAPSPVCTDAEFLRRATLDLIGLLPTADEARAFLASRDPNKRQKWIDALLDRPEYVDTWTYRLGDLLRNSRRNLGVKGNMAFHRYLRDAVARNRPWDVVARELITARGSMWDVGPTNYYGVGKGPEEWAENTSQVFLGVRIQCARCHNHPFDRWTQADYFSFAAFFARLKTKNGGERGDKTLFVADEGEVKHPKTGAEMPPRPLGIAPPAGARVQAQGAKAAKEETARTESEAANLEPADRREALARWLTAPENPWFARAMVNRLWGHLMGRGLIEPVDDLRATNPASNEAALQALTADFIANDYDLKHTLRVIANSATYQLSSEPNASNGSDETQFSRHVVRRLGAEQILDAVVQATGVPEKFPGMPLGVRAAQLPDTAVPSYFLDLFGRPARQVVCECERDMAPNLAQTLHIMNGDSVNAKIRSPEGHLAQLLATDERDATVLQELFLTTLTRLPTAHERDGALATIHQAPSRAEGFGDLLWALLNSREFLFSH